MLKILKLLHRLPGHNKLNGRGSSEQQTCQVGRRRCGDGWLGCLHRDGNDPPASYAFPLAGVDPVRMLLSLISELTLLVY